MARVGASSASVAISSFSIIIISLHAPGNHRRQWSVYGALYINTDFTIKDKMKNSNEASNVNLSKDKTDHSKVIIHSKLRL